MAIAFDSANSGNTGPNTASSLTVGNTIVSNVNGIVFGLAAMAGPSGTITAAYDGTSMTSINVVDDSGGNTRAQLFYLLAPPTGAKNCVFSYSAVRRCVGGVQAYTGVAQGAPLGTSVTGSGTADTTATINVGSASGEMVIAVVAKRNSTEAITKGAGVDNERFNNVTTSGTANNNVRGAGGDSAGAASVTMSWTWSTTGRGWTMVGVSMKPAGAAGASLKRNSSLSGLGASGPFFQDPLSGSAEERIAA